MLKGSPLSGAEVPVTANQYVYLCSGADLQRAKWFPIPTTSSGFPGLVALGGSTHGRKVLPVGHDWVPIYRDVDAL